MTHTDDFVLLTQLANLDNDLLIIMITNALKIVSTTNNNRHDHDDDDDDEDDDDDDDDDDDGRQSK